MDSRPIGCMCNLAKKKKRKIRNKYINILVMLDCATLQRGRVYFTMRVCHL